jgi:hypothetical protein
MSNDNADYDIGYGKPPKNRRFTSNHERSRGPRKRAAPDLNKVVLDEISALIEIKEGSRTRKVTTLVGLIRRLKVKALNGDHRSLATLISLILSASGAKALTEAAEGLTDLEKEMLRRNAKSLLAGLARDNEMEG